MKIIDGIAHVVRSGTEGVKEFYLGVDVEIKKMQSIGLEVEVQYQQSDCVVSALLLGRREMTT
ncbi:hypothetical protein [Desulfosporosinus sp.]|uniref:hypothetical protein n=1 Tax=Desulfosporosinus sp. TaxID=157907 RepID=UPI0026282218|nr:hypothetical protein [Desulfosporosinus sp.]